jgi:hypothetical protein
MYLSSRRLIAFNRGWFVPAAVTFSLILFAITTSNAQGVDGVNTTGTFGNEVIQGKIFFPTGSLRLK